MLVHPPHYLNTPLAVGASGGRCAGLACQADAAVGPSGQPRFHSSENLQHQHHPSCCTATGADGAPFTFTDARAHDYQSEDGAGSGPTDAANAAAAGDEDSVDGADAMATHCDCSRLRRMHHVITTRPLSPQSSAEDFKAYLANIQLLQSASKPLSGRDLRDLSAIFRRSGYRSGGAAAAGRRGLAVRTTTPPAPPAPASPPVEDQQPQRQRQPMFFFAADAIAGAGASAMGAAGPPDRPESSDAAATEPDDGTFAEAQKRLMREMHQEFWELPTNYQEKPLVFGSHAKNRYKTIVPNEHSRVRLDGDGGGGGGGGGGWPADDEPEAYINANFIKVSGSERRVSMGGGRSHSIPKP